MFTLVDFAREKNLSFKEAKKKLNSLVKKNKIEQILKNESFYYVEKKFDSSNVLTFKKRRRLK